MIRQNTQQGISLVEVLATIVILAIVSSLLFSVITDSKKQYSRQTEKNQELANISFVLKIITKEIRKNPDDVSVDSFTNTISFGEKGVGTVYKLMDKNLIKVNQAANTQTILANNISKFIVEEDPNDNDIILIEIIDQNNKSTKTKIIRRRNLE